MPIQRIPRYVLLLEDLTLKTPTDHLDYRDLASACIKLKVFVVKELFFVCADDWFWPQEITSHINDRKRDADRFKIMFELDKTFQPPIPGVLFVGLFRFSRFSFKNRFNSTSSTYHLFWTAQRSFCQGQTQTLLFFSLLRLAGQVLAAQTRQNHGAFSQIDFRCNLATARSLAWLIIFVFCFALQMERCKVVDVADFATVKHSFQLVHPSASLLLAATSESKKRQWVQSATAASARRSSQTVKSSNPVHRTRSETFTSSEAKAPSTSFETLTERPAGERAAVGSAVRLIPGRRRSSSIDFEPEHVREKKGRLKLTGADRLGAVANDSSRPCNADADGEVQFQCRNNWRGLKIACHLGV